MRPTMPEQLRGLRRILELVVAPGVVDEYPQTTLQGVIRALEMLEQRSDDVVPFLAWDNEETAQLLRSIAERHPDIVSSSLPLSSGNALVGVVALDEENERLRGALAEAIPALAGDPSASDAHAAVVAHMRARIARYPFASTGSLPTR